MGVFQVLKEVFQKEELSMLGELKAVFKQECSLANISAVINGVDQLIKYIESNIANESLRNAAIDAVIKLLQDEKR
jgi:hypothetical protein